MVLVLSLLSPTPRQPNPKSPKRFSDHLLYSNRSSMSRMGYLDPVSREPSPSPRSLPGPSTLSNRTLPTAAINRHPSRSPSPRRPASSSSAGAGGSISLRGRTRSFSPSSTSSGTYVTAFEEPAKTSAAAAAAQAAMSAAAHRAMSQVGASAGPARSATAGSMHVPQTSRSGAVTRPGLSSAKPIKVRARLAEVKEEHHD